MLVVMMIMMVVMTCEGGDNEGGDDMTRGVVIMRVVMTRHVGW